MSRAKAAASKERYPSHLGTREIVFTNMLLLGFEPGAMESKYNIPFTKDMFGLPNKKAFEVVMHFLFVRLNPVMAAEKFRVIWPICDKKQEQLFRRTVADWLQEISKEDSDAHLPRIVPSLFLSPGGDKFYTVLLYFTQYVVYKAIRGENGVKERQILTKPHLSHGMSPLSSVIVKSYQAATIQRQKQALEQTQVTLLVHRQWQEYVSGLVKDNRSLRKSERDLEHKVRDMYAKSYDLAQARGDVMTSRRRSGVRSDGEKEVLAVKRGQKLQKVRELWKAVDSLMKSQAPERDVVESILQEVAMKCKLDADDVHVQVPELLLRECEAEIQRRNIANVYPGGKLSLLSLIQLWNLALQLYLENIHQAPLARFDTIAPSVVTQVHTHHAHLSNAQALRSNLAKEVDELKSSIAMLKRDTSLRKTPGRSQGSLRQFHSSTLGLSLLPATPPVSFEPANMSEQTPARLHHVSVLKQGHVAVDTPEAVSRMSQAVDKAAMRTSGLVQGMPSSMLKDLRHQIHGTSKLPLPPDSNATSRNRRKIQSAPSKVASATAPQQPALSRPRPTPGQSHRKQITKSSRTSIKADDGNRSRLRRDEGRIGSAVKRSDGDGRWNDARTPRVRQTNNNASRTEPRKRVVKATPKAHQILLDQIADAVMSGDGMVDSISPLLSFMDLKESPDVDQLKDPLAALEQSAFVSKDKLSRTPNEDLEQTTDMPSPAIASVSRSSLLKQATRTLFNTPGRAPTTEPPGSLPRSQNQQNLTRVARLSGTPVNQEPNVSISNLMDLSNTSLLLQDSVHFDESSEVVFNKGDGQMDSSPLSSLERQQADLFDLSPTMQVPSGDSGPARLSISSPVQSLHTPARNMNDYKSSPLHRTGGTPSHQPLEDLEQTLLEITRTKTPQLPTRTRQRIGHLRTLEERPESDLITSTERSFSQRMNTDYAKSPVTKDIERHSLPDRTEITKSSKAYRSWTGSNVLSSLHGNNVLGNDEGDREQTKMRQISGGSQKSVTFSEHIDEQSFQSFGGVSAGNLDEVEEEYKRDDDFDLDIIDVHSMQAEMFDDFSTSPELSSKTADREMAASPLGESYLRRSPQSKVMEESSHSPSDSAVHSGLDLSPDFASYPSPQLQLEHISPMITPSKTPKLATRKGYLSQGRLVSSSSSVTGQMRTPFADQSSGYSDTPPAYLSHHRQDSLVEGLSSLKLSDPVFRSGLRNGKENMQGLMAQHHTPRASLGLEGLFDEDDSILIAASPLSKSLHEDGMPVISPPANNLIDI